MPCHNPCPQASHPLAHDDEHVDWYTRPVHSVLPFASSGGDGHWMGLQTGAGHRPLTLARGVVGVAEREPLVTAVHAAVTDIDTLARDVLRRDRHRPRTGQRGLARGAVEASVAAAHTRRHTHTVQTASNAARSVAVVTNARVEAQQKRKKNEQTKRCGRKWL